MKVKTSHSSPFKKLSHPEKNGSWSSTEGVERLTPYTNIEPEGRLLDAVYVQQQKHDAAYG